MVNAFYLRTKGSRRDKFKTKLDGVEVCNSTRIFSEAIQTTKSCTPSVRKSCSCAWEHVPLEGGGEDDGSP
jgi:hypothetical protein